MKHLWALIRFVAVVLLVGAALVVPFRSQEAAACIPGGGSCWNLYSHTYTVTNSNTGHSFHLTVNWEYDLYNNVERATSCSQSASSGVVLSGGSCPTTLVTCGTQEQASYGFSDSGPNPNYYSLFVNVHCNGSTSDSYTAT